MDVRRLTEIGGHGAERLAVDETNLIWRGLNHVVQREQAIHRAALGNARIQVRRFGFRQDAHAPFLRQGNDFPESRHPFPIACIQPAPPPPPVTPGDVNCDGRVTSRDAQLVLQFEAGLIRSLPCQENADVNGDGEINSVDAALILQFVAGLLDSLG